MASTTGLDEKKLEQEQRWGPGKRWWVGRISDSGFVRGTWRFPPQVSLVDATLREGEEVPGTMLTIATKLKLAEKIVEAGFQELEVGYAGVIDEHYEMIRALKTAKLPARISSHTRLYGKQDEWRPEVDRNLEVGADVLTMVGFCNVIGTAGTPWLPAEAVPERTYEMVSYAKSQGVKVGFGLADFVRITPENILACYRAAAAAGVDRVYVYDGVGAATPEAVGYITAFLRDIVGPRTEIAVHCHNTFGLAVANTLRVLAGGGCCADVVALGLGDGAGIAAAEEVAAALEVLYGVPTGIRLDKLVSLGEAVAKAFGISVPKTKAVVGENSYRHQIDSHVAAIIRGDWSSWEVMKPEVVGRQRRLEFGFSKLRRGRSGGIYAKIEQLGFRPSDEQLEEVFQGIKRITEDKGFASEQEAEAVIQRVLGGQGAASAATGQ